MKIPIWSLGISWEYPGYIYISPSINCCDEKYPKYPNHPKSDATQKNHGINHENAYECHPRRITPFFSSKIPKKNLHLAVPPEAHTLQSSPWFDLMPR